MFGSYILTACILTAKSILATTLTAHVFGFALFGFVATSAAAWQILAIAAVITAAIVAVFLLVSVAFAIGAFFADCTMACGPCEENIYITEEETPLSDDPDITFPPKPGIQEEHSVNILFKKEEKPMQEKLKKPDNFGYFLLGN